MLELATVAATLFGMIWSPANAEMNGATRIGVLNDMSSVYSDFQGPGSVVAAQMAAEEFAKQSKRKVEILSADHQNKPDIGAEIARRWFDVEGVDMIIDVPNSAVALAVADIARDKNRVFIGSGAGTALLTGAKCSPNTVHWTYDTWAMGHGVARGLLQQGGKTWFFVTADYAFGDDLQKQASEEINAEGGQVLGSVRHPLGTSDFSSFLLQAQASRAQVVGPRGGKRRAGHSFKPKARRISAQGQQPSADQLKAYAQNTVKLLAVTNRGSRRFANLTVSLTSLTKLSRRKTPGKRRSYPKRERNY